MRRSLLTTFTIMASAMWLGACAIGRPPAQRPGLSPALAPSSATAWEPGDPFVADSTHRRGPRPARKVVASKETPHALVADDATRCLVSESKFAKTQVGDWVWCVWTP